MNGELTAPVERVTALLQRVGRGEPPSSEDHVGRLLESLYQAGLGRSVDETEFGTDAVAIATDDLPTAGNAALQIRLYFEGVAPERAHRVAELLERHLQPRFALELREQPASSAFAQQWHGVNFFADRERMAAPTGQVFQGGLRALFGRPRVRQKRQRPSLSCL